MTTTADLIAETRRYLFSGTKEPLNRLSVGVDADDTGLAFDFAAEGIDSGASVAVELEVMHVWSGSSDAAVVERGQLGSTAAVHPSGAVVTVNPKFPDFAILQALNAELVDLSSPMNGLFQMKSEELTYNPSVYGYDLSGVLANDLLEIYEVRFDTTGSTMEWPVLDRGFWEFRRDSETDDFASGYQLLLKTGTTPGMQVRVVYRAPFGTLSNLTDDVVTTTGLPASAVDIPPLGAAMRLASMRDIQRSFNEDQGETRRAEEVPPGAQFAAVRGLMMMRDQRVRAEATRLRQLYPVRRY